MYRQILLSFLQKGRSEALFRERGGAEYGVAILYAGFKFVWRPTRIQNDHIWIWPTVQLIFIFLLINLKKKIVSPFLFLFRFRYVFMCWTLSWMCFNNRFYQKLLRVHGYWACSWRSKLKRMNISHALKWKNSEFLFIFLWLYWQ